MTLNFSRTRKANNQQTQRMDKEKSTKKFLEDCQYLGLKSLLREYDRLVSEAHEQKQGYYEFLQKVIHQESQDRKERAIGYRIKESHLPKPYKLLSDFDFNFQSGIKESLIKDISGMDFINRRESILFIGDCGTGKSHLARSLAMIACQKGYKVFYTTCSQMLTDLNEGVYEKNLARHMKKYISPDLLLIDEMGHDRLELEITKEAHLLFKVIDERYNREKPILFTTNIEEQDWAEYLGDPISTRAILDRIFHHSIKIEIKGPSYRKHESQKLQQKYNI